MPLWIDLEEFDSEDLTDSWAQFCPHCLEPLAVCECGYYPTDEIESEESEDDHPF